MTASSDFDAIFETSLEAIRSGQATLESALAAHPEWAPELEPQLETALWLQQSASLFASRPGFKADARQRLMERIKTEPRSPPGFWTRIGAVFGSLQTSTRGWQFAAAALLVVVLFATTFGIVSAAQHALPGETLYSVKITSEHIRLALSLSDEGDARLHLHFAEERLMEVQALVLEGNYDSLKQIAQDFEYHITQAANRIKSLASRQPEKAVNLVLRMRAALENQKITMQLLADVVPPASRTDFQRFIIASDLGIAETNEILATYQPSALPTATPTASPIPTETSTALIDTATITPTPAPTSTPIPSPTKDLSTPTPPVGEAGQVVSPKTDTPTPTATPGPAKVEPTTEEPDDDGGVRPTKKPSKTPKPTKTPKIKDKDKD